ncbi:hypothetical protein [Streptomyces lunalinharesii]|uniref:FXSXX-COOH protein n=1 Tax=Streptomyces lunalinharesii TaxID=333384 RepID=A0ABN3T5E1_9ACTN
MTAPGTSGQDHSTPRTGRHTTHDDLRTAAPLDVATIQGTISEVLHRPLASV